MAAARASATWSLDQELALALLKVSFNACDNVLWFKAMHIPQSIGQAGSAGNAGGDGKDGSWGNPGTGGSGTDIDGNGGIAGSVTDGNCGNPGGDGSEGSCGKPGTGGSGTEIDGNAGNEQLLMPAPFPN
jgi:hypothetical protein